MFEAESRMQRAHSMYEFMCQRARDKLMLWDEVQITQSRTHFISLYDRCIVSLGWCGPDIWLSGAGSGPRATNWGSAAALSASGDLSYHCCHFLHSTVCSGSEGL